MKDLIALSQEEISQALETLTGWALVNGLLTKNFRFKDYRAGIEFAVACGEISEEMNHHPDILIQWRKVRISICTHSVKAVTALDVKFAQRVKELED